MNLSSSLRSLWWRVWLWKRDPRIKIGRGTYGINSRTILLFKASDRVIIGRYCSFSYGVRIVASGEHNLTAVTTYPLRSKLLNGSHEEETFTKGCVLIGNDVWVGVRAMILSGVTVGDGAVIGAGALVVKDVPPFAVVGGVPARVLRYRFSADVVASLLRIRWWEWDEREITRHAEALSGDVREFLKGKS